MYYYTVRQSTTRGGPAGRRLGVGATKEDVAAGRRLGVGATKEDAVAGRRFGFGSTYGDGRLLAWRGTGMNGALLSTIRTEVNGS